MRVKVFKLEVMILDFDGIGEGAIISQLENTKYSNRCISPKVKNIEAREVDWDDNHPLNKYDTQEEAYKKLFEVPK